MNFHNKHFTFYHLEIYEKCFCCAFIFNSHCTVGLDFEGLRQAHIDKNGADTGTEGTVGKILSTRSGNVVVSAQSESNPINLL